MDLFALLGSLWHFLSFGSFLQWGESSPAKHGEAYFSAVVWPRILAITGGGFEKPHALHNSLEIHLARTFGATGKEQPSPPLHPAAAARLLSCRALRWCSAVFVWLSSIGFPNFWQIIFLLNSIAIVPSRPSLHSTVAAPKVGPGS